MLPQDGLSFTDMARYKAKGPDGAVHEMEGPDGASQSDILKAFSTAFQSQGTPGPQTLAPAPQAQQQPVQAPVPQIPQTGDQALRMGLGGLTSIMPSPDPEEVRKKAVFDSMDQFRQKIQGEGISPAVGMPGHILNAFEGIARMGRMGVKGYEEIGGALGGDKWRKRFGTAARFVLPTDKASSAVVLAGLADAAEKGPLMAKTIATNLERTKVIQPTGVQRSLGALISTTTSIPERHASAVVADPTILASSTPSVADVGKEYGKVFERLGVRFDTKLAQKYLNKNYIPGDTEAQTLNKKVFGIIQKLESGKTVPPEEAFLGRSMAASMERTTLAARNPTFKGFASVAKAALDNHLENTGVPEIKDLSAKYFRAITKEYFEAWLPQNKNMSPNALRGMIALKLAGDSLGHLAQGNGLSAAGKAVQAAAMSPLAVGSAIRGASAAMPGLPLVASIVGKNSVQWSK